ncbi:MAG: DUF6493 family protein [Prevotella sp.]|jgi:hypothetical protein|nr:DUF6493 family protein [Prevotella sp.]
MRVLRECLQTVNQDFKLGYAGWFAGLFTDMKPSEEELLLLQDDLFATFNSKHTKLPNKVLESLKAIAAHPGFRLNDFIASLPLLLSSQIKAIVNAMLTILDKVARTAIEKGEIICPEIAPVFLNWDEAIQKKAAKLIAQYGNRDSELIKESLAGYRDMILMSVREMLKPWLSAGPREQEENETGIELLPVTDEANRIPSIETLFMLKTEIAGITLLFLACCMICSEKMIRNYAGEIWLERAGSDLIDSFQFGFVIGKLLSAKWAPVKRLTDLITDNLMNISRKHNEALESMTKAALTQVSKSITNQKKLQVICDELNYKSK